MMRSSTTSAHASTSEPSSHDSGAKAAAAAAYFNSAGWGYEVTVVDRALWLVVKDDAGEVVDYRKATIYVFIEQETRFVGGVHISVDRDPKASLRRAIAYAFSRRDARLERIGVHLQPERWLRAHVPFFISTHPTKVPADWDMKAFTPFFAGVFHTSGEPLHPCGEAVVHRFLRSMAMTETSRGSTEALARILGREGLRQRNSRYRFAAVDNLRDAYRVLVNVVLRHNERPHRHLKSRFAAQPNAPLPTPTSAYRLGLERAATVGAKATTEEDFTVRVRDKGRADLEDGLLRFRGGVYLPANDVAQDHAAQPRFFITTLDVYVDPDRTELHMKVGPDRKVAHFRADATTMARLGPLPPDEADARASLTRRLKRLKKARSPQQRGNTAIPPEGGATDLRSTGSET